MQTQRRAGRRSTGLEATGGSAARHVLMAADFAAVKITFLIDI